MPPRRTSPSTRQQPPRPRRRLCESTQDQARSDQAVPAAELALPGSALRARSLARPGTARVVGFTGRTLVPRRGHPRPRLARLDLSRTTRRAHRGLSRTTRNAHRGLTRIIRRAPRGLSLRHRAVLTFRHHMTRVGFELLIYFEYNIPWYYMYLSFFITGPRLNIKKK